MDMDIGLVMDPDDPDQAPPSPVPRHTPLTNPYGVPQAPPRPLVSPFGTLIPSNTTQCPCPNCSVECTPQSLVQHLQDPQFSVSHGTGILRMAQEIRELRQAATIPVPKVPVPPSPSITDAADAVEVSSETEAPGQDQGRPITTGRDCLC
ncbi:hypothetical protein KIPB_001040 [Kipferlia bialata]|uniref:Uncharacterized protein n=1 Tax=Kipferlia bialata TaxID=797122 RepID=A0A9K3CPH9_9EUKA|nr:hypothetical protein KIPB_001040 [Kipferlia bialata]|eukprot:g1040.t1